MFDSNVDTITDCCKQKLLAPIAWAILLLGRLKRLFQPNHILAGAQAVECFSFSPEFCVKVVGGLDREADSTLRFVHLNDPSFNFLPNLQHIFDLCDMLLTELG